VASSYEYKLQGRQKIMLLFLREIQQMHEWVEM
jgi:hypothetical protein